LCPSVCMTCRMSLVLWYSIVAFQWRNVWKWICGSLGFWSFLVRVALCLAKSLLWVLRCLLNIRLEGLLAFSDRSCESSLVESLKIRGLLPFSGVMRIVPVSRSKSVHVSACASPALAPVSLSSWRNVEVFGPHPAISASNSASVGMKGSLSVVLYLGGSHFLPSMRRKAV